MIIARIFPLPPRDNDNAREICGHFKIRKYKLLRNGRGRSLEDKIQRIAF